MLKRLDLLNNVTISDSISLEIFKISIINLWVAHDCAIHLWCEYTKNEIIAKIFGKIKNL